MEGPGMNQGLEGSDPVSIEQELVQWANERPVWLRQVLADVCAGRQVDPVAVAEALVEGTATDPPPDLRGADIPGGSSSSQTVAMTSVAETKGLNALIDDQELALAPKGLTVIYGDNASGKSGYARVIKASSGARHQQEVLANVFLKEAPDPEARISFIADGESKSLDWPNEEDADLRRVHFYDEACGDAYLDSETKLTYRPSVLTITDQLINIMDAVRDQLSLRLQENAAERGALPVVEWPSTAQTFLQTLSAQTTIAEVEAASDSPPDSADQIAKLTRELARLEESSPIKERARLEQQAKNLLRLADHLERVEKVLGEEHVAEIVAAAISAQEKRAAADIASQKSFDEEPVVGVGTERWRVLWRAARDFSNEVAYHEHEFPFLSEGARCVLCQQEFSEEATTRLRAFDAYMQDETEKQAKAAEKELSDLIGKVRAVEIQPGEIGRLLTDLKDDVPELVEQSRDWLDEAERVRSKLLDRLEAGEPVEGVHVVSASVEDLRKTAEIATEAANRIDDAKFEQSVESAQAQRNELVGKSRLTSGKAEILVEVSRLKERAKIEAAKKAVDTGPVTRKASELTKTHVTALIRDRFTRETDRLGLERITLVDVGGQKGQLQQRPALLGAQARAQVGEVFSEGEQTALGLAGYFTEAYFDEGKSAMVLDDPVTSLDHVRRSRVAERLAEFAAERQVVVFTHDVRFVAELHSSAEVADADFTGLSVQRVGRTSPGSIKETLPWKAKDVGERFDELRVRLAKIEKERGDWTQEEYEEAVQFWAGRLSEVWERIVNLEVINQVVDRGTSEVKPMKFRLLAKITDQDNDELQQSYRRISGWAPRHDKDPDTNFVAPEPEILDQELELVKAWYARVRKYRNP